MQQSLLSLLLLTIVALCSTNELPLINRLELDFFENQDNDNTLNNKIQNRDTKKIFFKRFLNRLPLLKPEISNHIYDNKEDNGDTILNGRNDEENNYDDYFTQEQWKEYPKQTNSLSSRFDTKAEVISRSNSDHNANELEKEDSMREFKEFIDNHIINLLNNDEKVATPSPLLILKIHLSYLANDIKPIQPNDFTYTELVPLHSAVKSKGDREEYDKMLQNEIDSVVKVKREGADDTAAAETDTDKNKKIKKRIFSLWSRLQGLHRGHELHHRRYLHSFYGHPDDGGGGSGGDSGALTAETRATFMRPPGSPLRWG